MAVRPVRHDALWTDYVPPQLDLVDLPRRISGHEEGGLSFAGSYNFLTIPRVSLSSPPNAHGVVVEAPPYLIFVNSRDAAPHGKQSMISAPVRTISFVRPSPLTDGESGNTLSTNFPLVVFGCMYSSK